MLNLIIGRYRTTRFANGINVVVRRAKVRFPHSAVPGKWERNACAEVRPHYTSFVHSALDYEALREKWQ